MDLLWRSDYLWLVGLWTAAPDFHVVAVILVDRVVSFSLSLGWLDPDQVLPLLLRNVSRAPLYDMSTRLVRIVLALPLVDHALGFETV